MLWCQRIASSRDLSHEANAVSVATADCDLEDKNQLPLVAFPQEVGAGNSRILVGEPTPRSINKQATNTAQWLTIGSSRSLPGRGQMPAEHQNSRGQDRYRGEKLSIIDPSYSPWACPTPCIPKKDGTLRLCVDFRQLSVFNPYPIFQPLMDDISRPVEATEAYVDDVLISSPTWEQHLARLRGDLGNASHGLTVKVSKCTFTQETLGHAVG